MRRIAILIAFFATASAPLEAAFSDGQVEADVIIGQSSFSGTAAATSRTGMNNPQGLWVHQGKLLVSEFGNGRVIVFSEIPRANGASADVVIGKPDFNTSGITVGAGGLNAARTAMVDGRGRLVVPDQGKNRVLVWNSLPAADGAPADIVLGQDDFLGNGSGLSATRFNAPISAFSDGQRLFVSDFFNHRVLIWNSFPENDDVPADVVLGQPDFVTNTARTAQNGMNNPFKAITDGRRLYVVDSTNFRVLIWNSIPTANHTPADVVVGQSTFTSATRRVSRDGMSDPFDVATDGRMLFVAERTPNRVLVWKSIPTRNGQPADAVIGQPDFDSAAPGSAPHQLNTARGVFFSGKQLFISDSGNNRVLIYNVSSGLSQSLGPQFTQGKALLGKVFYDLDGDGEQDSGERGVEGIKVVSDTGIYAITDSDGKYHFPYLETGQRILKLDPITLPEGAELTTESPRKITVTEGVLSKVSFGLKLAEEEAGQEARAGGDDRSPKRSGPLLRATITQDPVLLKPKLSVRAERQGDKIVFFIETNYAEHIEEGRLTLYDGEMKVVKEIRLDTIPYRYELEPPQAFAGRSFRYGLSVRDRAGAEDRTDIGEIA
jgi:hypothetical protein